MSEDPDTTGAMVHSPDSATVTLTTCAVDWRRGVYTGPDRQGHLTTTERALLAFLARHPRRVVSRDELHREVWGHAASVQSRVADLNMARLRRKLEADPQQPRHFITVHGEGYRFEPLADGPSTGPDAPRAGGTRPGAPAIEPPATSLVGREASLAALRSALSTSRLVTVTGPGGVGKTRLARELALSLEGPAWLCELASAREVEDLCAGVAGALALPLGERDPVARCGELLRAVGPCTLVLDNLEGLVPHAEVIGRWLAAAPELRVLATSRVALGLPGEQRLPLEPLSLEGPEASALALLVARAQEVVPGWRPEPPDDALALVRRLDGLPLAIELAAARLTVLSLPALIERLDDRFAVLRRGRGGGRHDSLMGALEASWELLDGEQQAALVGCAVFEGPFDAEAAEVVVALPGRRATPALDLLQDLVDHSLLHSTTDGSGRVRLAMYETVSAWAREHLEDSGLADAVRDRHAATFARLGAESARRGVHGREGPALRAERRRVRHDLRAAVRHAASRGQPEVAVAAWLALVDGVEFEGPYGEALALGDTLRTLAAPAPLRARALWGLAELLDRSGSFEAAGERFAEALSLLDEARDPLLAAFVLTGLAGVASRTGAREDLDDLLARADVAADRCGDPGARGLVTVALADRRADQGDIEGAVAGFRAAIDQLARAGAVRAHALAVGNLGTVLWSSGHQEEGAELMLEAIALNERVGDAYGLASAHFNVGHALQVLGRFDEARVHLVAAQAGFSALGARRAATLACMAMLISGLEPDLDRRREGLEGCLSFFREVGDRTQEALTLGHLGRTAWLQGHGGRAERQLRASLELLEAQSPVLGAAFASDLAELRLERDDPADARHWVTVGLGKGSRDPSVRFSVARVRVLVALAEGDHAEAREAFAEAEALVADHGLPASKAERLAPLRAALEALCSS